MSIRLAAVQHGDFREASNIIGSGQVEPYFGMAYSLSVLNDLFGADPHLVVSLDSPRYRENHGAGQWVGMGPHWPKGIPRSWVALWWGREIVATLRRFAPTHVLLRSGGLAANEVLRYCIAHSINTAVILANRFEAPSRRLRRQMQDTVRLLNHPCVRLVGNHKQPATDSMVEHGVQADKAFAWDWPNARHPKDTAAKTLVGRSGPYRVAYVGTVSEDKGVGDLIAAIGRLQRQATTVQLTVMGDGPELTALQQAASALPPGVVTFLGRVSNDEAFRQMCIADLVCVPSRHEFSEGMPLTLTEALASRTPVVISDHPVFRRAFQDGQGVKVFPAKNPAALAGAIESVLSSPAVYDALSASTLVAYQRVECATTFGDLIERWKQTF